MVQPILLSDGNPVGSFKNSATDLPFEHEVANYRERFMNSRQFA